MKLDYGDYALEVDGVKVPIYFERKEIGDLFGTMGKGHKRFKAEMARAEADKSKLILVIEASFSDVLGGYSYSKIPGTAMIKKLATLYVKYGLEIHFFNGRTEMRRYIEEIFESILRNWVLKKKTKPPLIDTNERAKDTPRV